jgi:hypothetical protein
MTSEYAFLYEECDIPAGLTVREWRAATARPARRRRLRALFHRA